MSVPARAGEWIRERLRRGMVALAWFSIFHPRTVLILTTAITIGAVVLASRLKFSTDIDDLLPRNVQSAQLVKALLH